MILDKSKYPALYKFKLFIAISQIALQF